MTDARGAFLAEALDAVVAGGAAPEPAAGDAWQLAVASFVASERLEPARATTLSRAAIDALTAASEPVVRAAVFAARGFAAAAELHPGGWTEVEPEHTPSGDPIADALPYLEAAGSGDDAQFARYLLAEAALTNGRVGFAATLPIADPVGFLARDGRDHPFGAVFTVLRARVAAFSGRVLDAQRLLAGAMSHIPLLDLLLNATSSLVHGNAADPQRTRDLAERVRTENPRPDTRIAAGCHLLAAYGLMALDDVRGSAELVVAAGGDADLDHLMIVDRAIGFELLVNAADLDDDPDAAEAWASRAEALAGSPICDASLERTRSRILLIRGDATGAAAAAERAGALARAEGRMIEAAEADRLAGRASLAANDGSAARRLQSMAEEANRTGHRAAVEAAARELRTAGRRLRPLAGSEWDGLSGREREVARLLLDGLSNADIAAVLFVSPHTVRVHVSRVLAAFGVASRFALAARMPSSADVVADGLTQRQAEVVAQLSTGASNAEIADRLGISVKTVEKHLHEIMRRLEVTSRVGILRAAAAPVPVE